MVTFEFPEAPQETYIVTVDGQIFDCETLPSVPLRLFCSGPMVQEDILVPVQLEDLTSGALLLEQEISILCEQEQDEGDDLPVCSALEESACNARSDCDWKPSLVSGPGGGYCEVK